MKNYPTLSEMGVLHPQQIVKFAVNSIGYTDVLRIVYERPKGSVLPQTRTYKFPRVQKSISDSSAEGQSTDVMEGDPTFRAAVKELEDILQLKGTNQELADAILDELKLLEEDIALRADYLRTLVGKISAI